MIGARERRRCQLVSCKWAASWLVKWCKEICMSKRFACRLIGQWPHTHRGQCNKLLASLDKISSFSLTNYAWQKQRLTANELAVLTLFSFLKAITAITFRRVFFFSSSLCKLLPSFPVHWLTVFDLRISSFSSSILLNDWLAVIYYQKSRMSLSPSSAVLLHNNHARHLRRKVYSSGACTLLMMMLLLVCSIAFEC